MNACLSVFPIAAALVAISAAHAQVTLYLFPDGDGSVPSIGRDLSSDGTTAVGSFGCGSFVWRFDGSPIYLGSQDCTRYVQANAVSADGRVVVGYGQFDASGYADAFRWTPEGGVEVIGSELPEVTTYASCLSNDGSLIGGWFNGASGPVAARRLQNEVWTALPAGDQVYDCDASGNTLIGFGLNNTGVLWKWTQPLGFQALSVPDNVAGGLAVAVSDDGGYVAGTYWLPNGHAVATRWHPNGIRQSLAPNFLTMRATSMSGDGNSVGGYIDHPTPSMIRGFVWSDELGVDTLDWNNNFQGWRAKEISGFSTDGSAFTGYATKDGQTRAFIVRSVHVITLDSPQNIVVCKGSIADLSVSLTGYGTPQIRWEVLGANGMWRVIDDGPFEGSSSAVEGARTTSLQIVNVDEVSASSNFRCVVSTQCGTNVSGTIMLSLLGVAPQPCDNLDFNNDCSAFDPLDIEAFLSVYSEGPCVPAEANCNDIDFNNDGSLFDPLDIDSYLSVFSEGPCI